LSQLQIAGALLLLYGAYRAASLSRPHTISGTVIEGYGKGAKVGFKTANLLPVRAEGLPKGLYTCVVHWEGHVYEGLLFFGHNSLTKKICLEVHIINFDGDLYGKNITITTDKYLRGPKNFKDREKLAFQIKKDLTIM
jgi:riboflavin kinase/FMN adenylyltransferase